MCRRLFDLITKKSFQRGSMDSPETRQLSLSLFRDIKPICVQISQFASVPPDKFESSSGLISTLAELIKLLEKHHNAHSDEYVLSAKLADYIFFPLSCLLKHASLDPQVVRYILDIITFLTKYSWKNSIGEEFLDQLCPLVLYLAGGHGILSQKSSEIASKDFAFKSSAIACVIQILRCFPRLCLSDDTNIKRLSLLGDSTTLLLDAMCSFQSPLNQDENEMVLEILDLLQWLYSTRVTAEQASMVFPGMVSKIVNFSISTRNLHSSTVVKVLSTLSTIIVKVFDDRDLMILISDDSVTSENLLSLQDLTEDEKTNGLKVIPIRIDIKEKKVHRTDLWLRATSKQLKLSLLSLFKYLLFSSSMKTKVASNTQVSEAVFGFVRNVTGKCAHSLFTEVVQSGFDILSALIYITTSHSSDILEDELLKRVLDIYLRFDYTTLKLLSKQLFVKTEDLVCKQFPSVLALKNEEKVGVCIAAIKVHFFVLQLLTEIINADENSLTLLKESVVQTLVVQMSGQDYSGNTKKASKDELLRLLSGDGETKTNTMDDIELPPHINASSLTKIKKEGKALNSVQGSSQLRRLVTDWNEDFPNEEILLFGNIYSKSTERSLKGLLAFVGHESLKQLEQLISMITERTEEANDEDTQILNRSVSLWTTNQIFRSSTNTNQTYDDVDDFLDLEDTLHDDTTDETGYIVLEQALDLITQAKQKFTNGSVMPSARQAGIYQMAYVTALETVEILSSQMTKEDFQADFLMEHLFLLLEVLTFPADSVAHLQARKTLGVIVSNYYDGSIGSLILDNSDYLIDSLSMSLSVASGLTPSLPGILLVILKISGKQLLQATQLNDILSEIFIVIDSFHGYSVLVENFFLVFEVIVEITCELYRDVLSDNLKVELSESRYKPWGLTTQEQMLKLIDDNEKLVEVYEDFDLSKEYFKRKPGVPFGEQAGDSDDEEEEEEQIPASKENAWNLPIPKNTYGLIQQIFTYGLQFLSHPSDKLKIQVLRTLQKAYPIMSTNYSVLMPLLAQYWPMILVLTTGVSTTSEYDGSLGLHQLIEPSLRLTLQIINEDAKHEQFMSKRFIDMWEFWKRKSPLFRKQKGSEASKSLQVSRTSVSPAIVQLYVLTLIAGLNNYQRIIPDLTAIEMGEACIALGLPGGLTLSRDVEALLWVVRHNLSR